MNCSLALDICPVLDCCPCTAFALLHDTICALVLMSAGTSPNVQFGSVQSKLVSLGAIYSRSERFFPVAYLALMLEQHACNKGWEVTAVHGLLRELGVSMTVLFKIYDKMFKAKVRL